MPIFLLQCTCGSFDFEYKDDKFKCEACYTTIKAEDAGDQLIEEEC